VGHAALPTAEKRARRQHALIVVEDESGVSLLPSVRATSAPSGQTPVLRHPFNWKRLSLARRWSTKPMSATLISCSNCALPPTTARALIEFLTDLQQLEPGRRIVLLLPAHRSRCMIAEVQVIAEDGLDPSGSDDHSRLSL
jgi:hypothetical protein